MLMGKIYFGTTDGDLLEPYEISRIAFLTIGERISVDDLVSIKSFAASCKEITGEVKNPSIKHLIRDGHKVKAVKIYYKRHPEISLKEAKDIVDSMEEDMKKEKTNEQRT